MKLRLSPEQIQFRLSAKDYDRLKNSEVISERIHLASGLSIEYQVRSHPDSVGADGNALDFTNTSTSGHVVLILTVYRNAMDMLALPSHAKEGVKEFLTFGNSDMLTIAIDVDLTRRPAGA